MSKRPNGLLSLVDAANGRSVWREPGFAITATVLTVVLLSAAPRLTAVPLLSENAAPPPVAVPLLSESAAPRLSAVPLPSENAAPPPVAVPLSAARGQSERAVELTDRGKELLTDGEQEAALEEFDKAIAEDETFWEAWYQRGRALALLSRYDEATESLLRSTELNPGHANAHMLTAHAAMYAEDMELAWDQGIRAYLAGEDPQAIFGGLSSRSELPADFDSRIEAWRVYVAGIDTRDLMASAQNPTNARGGGTGPQERLVAIQPELLQLERIIAIALSDSRGFGLVPTAELAQYYVTISPEEIGASRTGTDLSSAEARGNERPSMSGYLRMYSVESEEPIYFRPVAFRDLSAAGQVRATLQNIINQMETWRLEQIQQR